MAGLLEGAGIAGIGEGIKNGLITGMTIANARQQQQMAMALNGLEKDENGNIVPTAQKQKQMSVESQGLDLKSAQDKRGLGLLTGGSAESVERIHGLQKAYDASHASDKNYHGPKGADIFPETMSGASGEDLAGKGLLGKDVSGEYGVLKAIANPLVGVKRDSLGFQEHSAAVKGVTEDSITKNLLNGYQSMQNALTEFKNNPSPQSFHTLQSVARMNAGSNNRSGVSERADQYATDLGIKKDEAVQLMTGNMQDVNLSSPQMVQAVMKVMNGELAIKQQQAAQQIGKKKKAFASIYSRPDMQDFSGDFSNTVADQYKQFDLDENGRPANQAPPPGAPTQQQDPAVAAKIKRLQELKAKAGME